VLYYGFNLLQYCHFCLIVFLFLGTCSSVLLDQHILCYRSMKTTHQGSHKISLTLSNVSPVTVYRALHLSFMQALLKFLQLSTLQYHRSCRCSSRTRRRKKNSVIVVDHRQHMCAIRSHGTLFFAGIEFIYYDQFS